MFKKLGLYYRTIKHLKPIQIRYRLWYRLRDKIRKLTGHSYPLSIPRQGHALNLEESIPSSVVGHPSSKTFTFLNQSHSFEEAINWNIKTHGKLWAYNLNYFDYLNQPEMSLEEGLKLIEEFINAMEHNREGLEPYPISLRAMNWIKFLSRHRVDDSGIAGSLYAQYCMLMDNLEYHLLGNHLLENGCSLLFGAFYFRDERLWQKAKEIIYYELEEQILEDGGHYERSVMYHCIMLERLLDGYNLLQNNDCFPDQQVLKDKLSGHLNKMMGWLEQMAWQNGDLPEVNDHIPEMVAPLSELFTYADRLGLQAEDTRLGDSGYRKYSGAAYEVLADAGNIGPDYQPGHAHSDIFSFILRINGEEIITDTGTSTYEDNQRRIRERSTAAHNTVMVEGEEQNEMWSAFRVGCRGLVRIISEQEDRLAARHDGYRWLGVIHEREFRFDADKFTIRDLLKGDRDKIFGTFYLHFYPGIEVQQNENIIKGPGFEISFNGHTSIDLNPYEKAVGYHNCRKAIRACIAFQDRLSTTFKINTIQTR